MSTTLELPDDVATALSKRAKRGGQAIQEAGVQLRRQALAADAVGRTVDAPAEGRLETDPRTGLYFHSSDATGCESPRFEICF